jgi:hypothetical protein
VIAKLRQKNLHTWLPGYARFLANNLAHGVRDRLRARVDGPRHLLFAFCDHYEPLWGNASPAHGDERVRAWQERYPTLARQFTDADGHHPRHSFFFPGEQYAPEYLDRLASLCRAGLGEVEFHLHHDGDTADQLRTDLKRYLTQFAGHGHLSRDPDGRRRFAFIHGNWCLANARRDKRWCGVDDEIPLLFESGCYADFTFPSAPDECQPNVVNQIYWPDGAPADLGRARAYEKGVRARVGELKRDRILLIEGPLALARRPGSLRWRIESAAVTAADPGTPDRVRTWIEQGIHVAGRPEWVFVKVHTHGAPDAQAASLLGDGGLTLHRSLATYNDGRRFLLHYVTAREMFNIAVAAMEGHAGDPGRYRDHVLPPPEVARA